MADKPVTISKAGGKKAVVDQITGFRIQIAAGATAANNATAVAQLKPVVVGLCNGLDTFLTSLVAYLAQN